MNAWDDSLLHNYIDPIIARMNESTTEWLDPMGPFDALAPLIGEEHITSMGAPPKIIWVPTSDDGYDVSDEQPDDATATYMTTTLCNVVVWGRTAGEVERLRTALLNRTHEIYSGGAVYPKGRAKYSRGVSSGEKGITIQFQMAFKVLLLSTMGPVVEVDTVNLQPLPDDAAPPEIGEAGAHGIYVSDELGVDPVPLPQ